MTAFRLSPFRNKGWLRFTLAGTALTIPAAAIEHSLGYFSDGVQGWTQASEFIGGAIAIVLIVGFSASWVLHGFAVKAHDDGEDEEKEGSRSSARPSGPPPSSPGGGGRRPPAGQKH